MTTYNPPTDAELTAEKGITQDKMRRLRDIGPAITEGALGAPKIQADALDTDSVTAVKIAANAVGASELASNAVHQAELYTSNGTVSVNLGVGSTGETGILPSSTHGFVPRVYSSVSDPDHIFYGLYRTNLTTSWTAPACRFYNGGNAAWFYGNQTYVLSSPPYDLGDGVVGLFMFAEIRPNGQIKRMYISEDGPWHDYGPTNCKAQRYDKQGRGWRHQRVYNAEMIEERFYLSELKAKVSAGGVLTQNEIDRIRDLGIAESRASLQEIEITQSVKQADMSLIQHPFMGVVEPGNTVVLLDPVSDFNHLMTQAHKVDEHDLAELFSIGALKITNTELSRSGPLGVPIVDFGWKSGAGIVK